MKLIFHKLRTALTLLATILVLTSHTTHAMHQLATACVKNLSQIKKTSLNPFCRYPVHGPKHYERFITYPRMKKAINHDLRAPDHVQQLSDDLALAMLEHDKSFYIYLKTCGYLTVYEGADKKMPNFFEKEPECDAYCSFYGGTHFPKNSFPHGASALQRFILGHENGHITRGDTTTLTPDLYQNGSAPWYQDEHRAQELCTHTLYEKFKDYEALEARLELEHMVHKVKNPLVKSLLEFGPLCTGLCGTLHKLSSQHKHDKRLRAICSEATVIAPSSIEFSQDSWEKPYRQFMVPFMIYQGQKNS